jgi:hypothetical protein
MFGKKENRVSYFRRLKQWINVYLNQEIQEIPEKFPRVNFPVIA